MCMCVCACVYADHVLWLKSKKLHIEFRQRELPAGTIRGIFRGILGATFATANCLAAVAASAAAANCILIGF